jgi:hypothetical protein
MKKMVIAFGLSLFSLVSFANENSTKSTDNKEASTKKSEVKEEKVMACVAGSYKVYHTVNCGHFSWYTVDWVDTIETTCVNGVAVRKVYHWEQSESLLCH